MRAEDAVLIFKKWESEGTELHCEFKGFACGVSFFGRILSISNEEATVASSDGKSKLRLPLRDLLFGYGDSSGFLEIPGWEITTCILAVLPPQPKTERREVIIFSSIPPIPANLRK
jgi:hypothetical protein